MWPAIALTVLFGFLLNQTVAYYADSDVYGMLKSSVFAMSAILDEANDIFRHGLTPNITLELQQERKEMLEKARGVLQKMEEKLEMKNGNLKCMAETAEEMIDEIMKSLDSLHTKCWETADWRAMLRKVVDRLKNISWKMRVIHDEYPQVMENCVDYSREICEMRVTTWALMNAARLQLTMKSYMEIIALLQKSYYKAGNICQNILYERILLIESRVQNGFNEC